MSKLLLDLDILASAAERIVSPTDEIKNRMSELLAFPQSPADINKMYDIHMDLHSRSNAILTRPINVDSFDKQIANAKFLITETEVDYI